MQAFLETFAPLRNQNLSRYLTGQAVSLVGTFMQATALSWVVWQLSESSRALGLVSMLGSLPLLLFGAFGGAWADRLNRRRVLIGTQVAAMLLAFLFAVLLQTDMLQLWHVYLLALALGCVSALDMPAQGAFIGDLTGVAQVRQATVINAMVMQVARMVGPALAGWTMGALGVAPAFWINGASFLAVIGSLLAVRAHQETQPARERPRGAMLEGLRFVGRAPRLQDLLLFSLIMTFFGFTSVQLLPAIVSDSLHAGPEALGLIMGASGFGALCSSLLVVPLVQRVRQIGWGLAGAVLWSGLWLGVLALSHSVLVAATAMFLCSLSGPVVNSTSMGLIQALAPAEMRGRLTGIWLTASFGTQPIASLLISFTGGLLGAVGAVVLNAGAMVLAAMALLLVRPGLRQWAGQQ